ncbi:MAG TPA: TM2 domain-containing protein [Herpetosiphonaceae bacterium]
MSDYPNGTPPAQAPYSSNPNPPPYQQPQYYTPPPQYTMQPHNPIVQSYPMPYVEQKSKVAAALLAFFLGGLGIHGFYLGNTGMGLTLLVINLVSVPLMLIGIGFLGWFAVGVICLIQTILYIAASDQEFYHKYVIQKRWF